MVTKLPESTLHPKPIPDQWNQAKKTAGIVLLVGGALAVAAGAITTAAFMHGPFAQTINLGMLNGTLLGRKILCGCFGGGVLLVTAGGILLYNAKESKQTETKAPKPSIPLPILDPNRYKSPFPLSFWTLEESLNKSCRAEIDKFLEQCGGRQAIDIAPLKAKLEKAQAYARESYAKFIASLRASSHPIHAEHIVKLEECLKSICNRLQAKLDFLTRKDIAQIEFSEVRRVVNDPITSSNFYKPKTLQEQTLMEIEEALGIRENVRQLLIHILDGIMCNDPNWRQLKPGGENEPLADPKALAVGLRLCRQFLSERYSTCARFGVSDAGHYEEVLMRFKDILHPQATINIHSDISGVIRQNQNYLLCDNSKDAEIHDTKDWAIPPGNNWIMAYFEHSYNHFGLHVYSNENGEPRFVKLDNVDPQRPKSSLEKMKRLDSNYEWFWKTMDISVPNLDTFVLPTVQPKPETWILPQWENNNCFLSVALAGLALVTFYEAQKKPIS